MAQVLRSVSVMVVPLMVPPNPQAVVTPAELASSALPMMPPKAVASEVNVPRYLQSSADEPTASPIIPPA